MILQEKANYNRKYLSIFCQVFKNHPAMSIISWTIIPVESASKMLWWNCLLFYFSNPFYYERCWSIMVKTWVLWPVKWSQTKRYTKSNKQRHILTDLILVNIYLFQFPAVKTWHIVIKICLFITHGDHWWSLMVIPSHRLFYHNYFSILYILHAT